MSDGPHSEARLHALIDGELEPSEARSIEASMRDDPEQQERLQKLRRVDAGLQRVWNETLPADAASLPSVARSERRSTIGRLRPIARIAAYAAVVALAVSVWLFASSTIHRAQRPDADAIYAKVTERFEPMVICDTPEKFIAYTEEHLGAPITADFVLAGDRGVTLVGWRSIGGSGYGDSAVEFPPRGLLIEGPGGERILSIFRRLSTPAPQKPGDPSLRMFTRRLDGIVVHEITPLGEPVSLDLVSPMIP